MTRDETRPRDAAATNVARTEKILWFANDPRRPRDKRLALGEHIDGTLLRKAVKHYAPLHTEERPLLLLNAGSLFRRTQGLLITDARIYVGGGEFLGFTGTPSCYVTESIAWGEIQSVDLVSRVRYRIDGETRFQDLKYSWIRINGSRFFGPSEFRDRHGTKQFVAVIVEAVLAAGLAGGERKASTTEEVPPLYSFPPIADDTELDTLKSPHDCPFLVCFSSSGGGGPVMQMAHILYSRYKYRSRFTVLQVHIMKAQNIAREFGIGVVPTFAVIHNGRVVLAVTGADWEKLRSALDELISRLDSSGLDSTEIGTLAEASSRLLVSEASRIAHTKWLDAMMSGFIVGGALAVVRYNHFGIQAWLPVVFLYGWLIMSFGLTSTQKLFVTGMMWAIGFFGPDLLLWLLAR